MSGQVDVEASDLGFKSTRIQMYVFYAPTTSKRHRLNRIIYIPQPLTVYTLYN